MPEGNGSSQREGLSPKTLVIAAIASGTAAIATSYLWQPGTVLAAAMTPVVISVLKELLERPIQSDVVRKSASRVGDVATVRRAVAGGAAARTDRERRQSPATGTIPPPPPPEERPNRDGAGQVTEADVLLSHPRRTYGGAGARRGRLKGPRLKLAIVTGLLAFVVAAVALTVPELVLGGSVGSQDRSTTFFGGGKKSDSETDRDGESSGGGGDTQRNPGEPSDGGDGAAPAPAPEAQPAPEEEAPEAAPPEAAPAPAPAPAPTTP